MEKKSKLKVVLFSVVASLFLSYSFYEGFVQASAGVLCDTVGTSGMKEDEILMNLSTGLSPVVIPDKGNRKYTTIEIFSQYASSYAVPMGASENKFFFLLGNTKVEDFMNANGTPLTEEQKERLLEHGNTLNCVYFGAPSFAQNFSKAISSELMYLVKLAVTSFFDTGFICADPENPTGNCINLMKIIGGENQRNSNDKGIMGMLSNGIFLPLLILAVAAMGIWYIYVAIIKREFRNGLQGVAWSLLMMLFGLLVIEYPWVFARAPHIATTTISSCIIDAMNGENCLDDSFVASGNVSPSTYNDCTAYIAGSLTTNEKLQLRLTTLNCSIEKSFTINRWAEEQFGYSFDDLYTKNAPEGRAVYPTDLLHGKNPDDYCVNMYHDNSPKDFKNSTTVASFADNAKQMQVCNIALAYMANRTNMDFGNKAKMEHIVATATLNPKMWSAMTGKGRDLMGIFSAMGIVFIAISFIPVALFGHAYSLMATLSMLFAPIFLLFAIHPGRGKKIFLGWLESVLEFCLKFMASAIFLLVMVNLYSAVFVSLSGFGVYLVSLILAFTFTVYRKEFINMFSSVGIGGQKMGNKFLDKLKGAGKKTKNLATGAIGGAIGGAFATGNAEGALKGAKKGLGMELRKGTGLVANAFRHGNQVKSEYDKERRELNTELRNEQRRIDSKTTMAKSAETLHDTVATEIEDVRSRASGLHPESIKESQKQILDIISANTQSDGVNTALEEHKKAIDESEQEITIEVTCGIANEAKAFNRHYNNGNINNGERAVKEYFDEYRLTKEDLILQNASLARENFENRGVDKKEYEGKIEEYIVTQEKKLEEHLKEISEFVEIKSNGVGVNGTDVSKINLTEMYHKKTAFRESMEDAYQNLTFDESAEKTPNAVPKI